MTTKKFRRVRLAALAVALFVQGGIASAGTALTEQQGALLDKVETYLNDMRNLKGEFTQVGPAGTISTGVFYISKPGKMRFEYAPPNPFLVVSDGRWVTVKNEAKNKADQYPVSATPLNLILAENVDLQSAEVMSVEEKEGAVWVTIESKDKIVPGQLVLIYDLTQSTLQQWIVVDGQGRKTTVSIANVENTGSPDPMLFKVEVPNSKSSDDGGNR
jgi:outer membrane lipoprotein-sorting protein